MANTRLTVVVRKDLQMPQGLLAAQVSHIAMEFLRQRIIKQGKTKKSYALSEFEREWIITPYISILAVNCREDLESVWQHCIREKLPCELWKDTIPSQRRRYHTRISLDEF